MKSSIRCLVLVPIAIATGCNGAPTLACDDPAVRQEVLVRSSEAVLNFAVSPAGFEARLDEDEEWFSIGLAEGPMVVRGDSLILTMRGTDAAYVLHDVRQEGDAVGEEAECSARLTADQSQVPLTYTVHAGPRGVPLIRGEASFQETLLSFRGEGR